MELKQFKELFYDQIISELLSEPIILKNNKEGKVDTFSLKTLQGLIDEACKNDKTFVINPFTREETIFRKKQIDHRNHTNRVVSLLSPEQFPKNTIIDFFLKIMDKHSSILAKTENNKLIVQKEIIVNLILWFLKFTNSSINNSDNLFKDMLLNEICKNLEIKPGDLNFQLSRDDLEKKLSDLGVDKKILVNMASEALKPIKYHWDGMINIERSLTQPDNLFRNIIPINRALHLLDGRTVIINSRNNLLTNQLNKLLEERRENTMSLRNAAIAALDGITPQAEREAIAALNGTATPAQRSGTATSAQRVARTAQRSGTATPAQRAPRTPQRTGTIITPAQMAAITTQRSGTATPTQRGARI